MHGIFALAATGMGEPLALFERRLPADEQPVLISIRTWNGLPADPRPIDPTSAGARSSGDARGEGTE
ncbi:MAG: hypothetical protein ACTHLH_08895 [Solirubrobacterales bacterium]